MAGVLSLLATLGIDTSEYDKGLSESEEKGKGWGSTLGAVAKGAGAAIAAVGTTAATLAKGFIEAAGATASYGDNIDKMSQKMGLSATAYQEWDFILQHCGTSIDSLQPSMKTLATAAEKGNSAFETLGMSLEDISTMSQEELFSATISALQNVEDTTQRTYLAGQLLGRGATELGALLNTSAEDIEEMRTQVHELGGVMSDEAVAAAAAYQDSLQNMTTAFSGIKNNLMSEFLPSITQCMDGIAGLFSGDGGAIEKVNAGLQSFVSKLSETITAIVPIAASFVATIADAIVAHLPALIDSAVAIIMQLVNSLISMLPQIADAAVQIIYSLTTGLTNALPTLIPAAVAAIATIVQSLIDRLPELLQAGLRLILSLGDGILAALPGLIQRLPAIINGLLSFFVQSTPQIIDAGFKLLVSLVSNLPGIILEIVKAVPQIIGGLVNAFGAAMGTIAEIGVNLVKGIWEGIKGATSWLWDKLTGWVGDAIGWIGGLFGIHSPSTVMRDKIGLNIGKGVAVGIVDSLPDVEGAFGQLMGVIPSVSGTEYAMSVKRNFSDLYAGGINAMGNRVTEALAAFQQSIVIKLDDRELGRAVRSYA